MGDRVGMYVPGAGTAHCCGCQSDAFGKHQVPLKSKARNASGSAQEIPAEISSCISITPLCLNTLFPSGELSH